MSIVYYSAHTCTYICDTLPLDNPKIHLHTALPYVTLLKTELMQSVQQGPWSSCPSWALPWPRGFFRSPIDTEYIPGTITDKATMPHSYFVEAQGKRYQQTREHIWPIHTNLSPQAPKQHLPRPKLTATCIPKPNPLFSSFPRPLPGPLSKPPCHIPCPHAPAVTACPSVEDLLLHLSTLNPLPSASVSSEKHWMPSAPRWAPTPPATPEEWDTESPSLQCDSFMESDNIPALWTVKPALPHTCFALGCPSLIMKQPSVNSMADHRLEPIISCLYHSAKQQKWVHIRWIGWPCRSHCRFFTPTEWITNSGTSPKKHRHPTDHQCYPHNDQKFRWLPWPGELYQWSGRLDADHKHPPLCWGRSPQRYSENSV